VRIGDATVEVRGVTPQARPRPLAPSPARLLTVRPRWPSGRSARQPAQLGYRLPPGSSWRQSGRSSFPAGWQWGLAEAGGGIRRLDRLTQFIGLVACPLLGRRRRRQHVTSTGQPPIIAT
jgi:hypothetical protein